MKTNDLSERLKKSLENPTQSVLPKSSPITEVKNKSYEGHLARPVTITLFKEDLARITEYRAKRAGEGTILNVSEVIRESLRKL